MKKIIASYFMLLSLSCLAADRFGVLDSIQLGDRQSELAHHFSGPETEVVKGGRDEFCRRILKPKQESWQSAPMSFQLKVAPDKRNYITVKFWGGDISHDHLLMFIDGRQMGYLHLGDYDILDYEACEPRDAPLSTNPNPQYAGRFTWTTFLLPETATKGKSEIEVSIRAIGRIWGYGNTFEQFQKNVTMDSRGIYGVFIHGDPYFRPDDPARTDIPRPVPRTDIPGVDIDAVKEKVNGELKKSLKANLVHDDWRIPFLAEAWHVSWCAAYRNPEVVNALEQGIDELARLYAKEPEKVVKRGSWIGCAAQAKAVILLEDAFRPGFDEMIDNGSGKKVRRRDLWADLFEASTFQLVRDRRWLANQSQIVDNSGHLNNRATHILNDARGVPLSTTLKFVKESLGILPWSHAVNPDLSPAGKTYPLGPDYRELTKNYLSKELGYVGNYGESTIWASADIYESTIDPHTGKGDPEIYNVMEKAALARTIFRYPGVTAGNHPVMRLEVYIDWRNAHFPGEPAYVGSELDLRTLYYTRNPKLLGCFKDMLKDGYFQDRVADSINPKRRGRPDYCGLLHVPERYAAIVKELPDIKSGMPMRGEDFVFADEEDGVVAVKCGDDVLFAELYWRANRGINNLAKIHYITPKSEHVATIYQEEEFIPSGKYGMEPDWVVYGFRPNRFNYPGGYYKQLNAGMKIPEAEHAEDSTLIGKAEFYRCSYGPYEIGMNNTRRNKTCRFRVPDGGTYRILPQGSIVRSGTSLEVKPGTTIVLCKIEDRNP